MGQVGHPAQLTWMWCVHVILGVGLKTPRALPQSYTPRSPPILITNIVTYSILCLTSENVEKVSLVYGDFFLKRLMCNHGCMHTCMCVCITLIVMFILTK